MATAEISKSLEALERARNGLKTALKPTDCDCIKGRRFLKDLDRGIEDLRQAISQQALSAAAAPPQPVVTGPAAPAPPEATEMRISDFFESVGEGVVAAQEQLDRRSKEYLETKPELALPALYRIPKASAEIHFAIEQSHTEKFSVLVYGASDTRQHQQQHKVSFDIISAPPPAEMLERIEPPRVRDVFVIARAERAGVRDRLLAYARKVGAASQSGRHARGLAGDIFDQVLILRSEAFWALLLPRAREQGGFTMDVAYVFSDRDKDPQLHGKWPPVAKMDERFDTLLELFLDLSGNQERHLSGV